MGHRHVLQDQYATLAMMIIEGWPQQEIADKLEIPLDTVKRYAKKRETPRKYNETFDRLQKKWTHAVVSERFEWISKKGAALKAIEDAIESSDKRLAAENAWKVIDRLYPKAPTPTEGGPITMFAQHNTVNNQIADVSGKLLETFGQLKRMRPLGYEKHLKTGLDGLPEAVQKTMTIEAGIAETEAEVVDVPEGAPDIDEEHPNA
jgi:hypothetical protein